MQMTESVVLIKLQKYSQIKLSVLEFTKKSLDLIEVRINEHFSRKMASFMENVTGVK